MKIREVVHIMYKLEIADEQTKRKGRIRVQDILLFDWEAIIGSFDSCRDDDYSKAKLNCQNKVKDYFNKQFSAPKPIECKICNGIGVNTDSVHNINGRDCGYCNGTGIEKYVGYLYDAKSAHDFGAWVHKGRPFKAIVNPFVNIVKIGADK